MPYISEERRERIQLPYVSDVGELTFVVDKLAEELLWKETGYDWDKVSYELLAKIDGALGLAQAEFRRRIVAPYEDVKIEKNGDVFVVPHPELWGVADVELPPLEAVPDHLTEAAEAIAEIRGGAA